MKMIITTASLSHYHYNDFMKSIYYVHVHFSFISINVMLV